MILTHAVVGSLILMKRRVMSEAFPSSWRKTWKRWELRGLILLSLLTQIVLVFMGNRKKKDGASWRRATVWLAYLLADSVATMTAGILSHELGDVYIHTGFLDANSELTAFWAPLLLLHLGGTDAITAYSLEDNELWKRHVFGVISQTMVTIYIMIMAWTGSKLSVLFTVMFFVGLVKYCERVWVLYLSSDNKFRDSNPDITANDSKIMEESRLKELEGYHLKTHQVLDLEVTNDFDNTSSSDDANEIRTAYRLLEMVRRLFADMILSFKDRDASTALFMRDNMTWEKCLKVIEIELGIIYDLLYTKATVVYSRWGIARRIVGIIATIIVLLVLSFDKTTREKQLHSNIDFTITLVLLTVAPLLELSSFVVILFSDQTTHWLSQHNKTNILRVINCCAPKKKQRWSNSIGQLNLLSISIGEKPLPCHGILKKLCIDEMLEIHWYEKHVPLVNDLKEYIFQHFKTARLSPGINCSNTDLKALYCRREIHTLKAFEGEGLEWCAKMDFDQSILIWHLATEICDKTGVQNYGKKEECKVLSQYMLYLLVKHPKMLPIGMAHIRFQEIYINVRRFIEEELSRPTEQINEVTASKALIKMNTEVMLANRGNGSYFVIFHACKLASVLESRQSGPWGLIIAYWVDMLGLAACKCKGTEHAQQLRRGGELITHVWLLMAHLGLTDNFQITRSRATAEAFLS